MEYLAKGSYPPVPVVPDDWDFKKADQEFDDMIYQWRRLTIDVLKEAYSFYLALAIPWYEVSHSPNGEREF